MTEKSNSLKTTGLSASINRKSFLIANLMLLAVNLAVFAVVSEHPERIGTPDEYSTIAQSIAFNGKYARYPIPFPEWESTTSYGRWVYRSAEPDAIRVPGYPVFLASFYKAFGYGKIVPVVANILVRMLAVNLVMLIFFRSFNPAMAVFFGVVNALDLSSLVYTFQLASEILFAFFLVASLLFYRKFSEAGNKGHLFVSFVLAGITVLVRAVAVLFPFVLLAAAVLKEKKNALKICAGFILALSLTLGPWVYRNYRVFNVPGLTAISGFNMFYHNAACTYMMERPGTSEYDAQNAMEREFASVIEKEEFRNKNSFEKSIILGRLGREYIMNRKLSYLKIHLKGSILSLTQSAGPIMLLLTGESRGTGILGKAVFRKKADTLGYFLSAIFIFYNLSLLCLYLLAILGLAKLAGKKGGNNLNFLIACVILYFLILPGPAVFTSFERFRAPVMPLILFFSSYGLFGGKIPLSPPFAKGEKIYSPPLAKEG
ncbi:MAG: glycosyltransferase family 39 protein [Candidatus Omnitrophica bacterium]|nr:glycosyltransferase family 39 protein [Candidatus Omnitrophota bacterium]